MSVNEVNRRLYKKAAWHQRRLRSIQQIFAHGAAEKTAEKRSFETNSEAKSL
jgi:hypothetical protein